MIFDTHSHCYFEKLAWRIDEVQRNALLAGVTHTVQIGCDVASSISAIELARRFDHWYATVGYHPVDAQNPKLSKNRAGGKEIGAPPELPTYEPIEVDEDSHQKNTEIALRKLVEAHRDIVVAIGETGLDNHYLSQEASARIREVEAQYYWFERLAIMAQDYQLPLIIHSRDARRETVDAIKKYKVKNAVIHCFSEDYGFAQELMSYSDEIYFSFSGILTYPNATEIQEAAKKIPLDRILIETDAPFLSPQKVRGKVNEPSHTRYVLEFLANIRNETLEVVESTVFENSLKFYGIAS